MKTSGSQSSKNKIKVDKSDEVILVNSATLANSFKYNYFFGNLSNIKVRKSTRPLTQIGQRTINSKSSKNSDNLYLSRKNSHKVIIENYEEESNIIKNEKKRLKTLKIDKKKKYIFNDMNYYLKSLKTEAKDNSIDNKNFDNLSLYSTKWYTAVPKTPKVYYTLNNNQSNKWKKLLKSSEKFNKYNNDRFFSGKINDFKHKDINIHKFKKFQQFSYKKSIPIKVAFGIGKSTNEISEIDNNYNFNKKLKQQKIKKINPAKQIAELYKYGYSLENEKELNLNTKKNKSKSSKKSIFLTDSSQNKIYSKGYFSPEAYSVFTKHKILKNILPKDVDYNTKASIDDILNSEIHPLLRHQKKLLAQNTSLISQELNVLFGHYVRLCQRKKTGKNDEKTESMVTNKFIELMSQIIRKDEEKQKISDKDVNDDEEENNKIKKKKYLIKKFREVIILAYKKFKKFNIDINIFYSLMDYNKNDPSFQMELINKGQYLFKAIKAGDIPEIINLIKKYNYLVAYKDDFNQIPLHICAKRNLYKLIYFLLSHLSSIDSQDLGGRTPLMIAAKNNFFEFCTILLFEGANPSIKDFNNNLASEMTTNNKLKIVLKRAEILNNLSYFIQGKNFQNFMINGLDFLFKKELEIDYEEWINEGKRIAKSQI